jgi:hypothetical protein
MAGPPAWKSERVFLSEALQGERVGLLAIDDRYLTVYFAAFPIASSTAES